MVEDLDSCCGIFINGVRIRGPSPLKTGDEVLVATVEVRVDSA